MSKTAVLRALVTQRLTAAAEEILVLFERSIEEYEQEVLVLTQNISSQQQRPSSPPSHETTTDIKILSVRQVLGPIKEEPVEQLQEPTFAPTCLNTKDEEDQLSLHWPIPTEESREENNDSDLGEDAAPLTPQVSDNEEGRDSSETEDSDDYSQEPAPAKRRNTTSSSDSSDICDDSCSTHSDQTQSSSSEHIPFSCLECGKMLRDKRNIEKHMRTHIGGQTFRCIICEEKFSTIKDLTWHKRKVHYVCQYCPRRFESRGALKSHLIVHTKERKIKKKLFRCLKCGKGFVQEKTLTNHLKYHTEFQCSVCTETFPSKRQRLNHMEVHMGNRPFVCAVCKRNFKTQRSLVEHTISHCEERPFSCPVCGRSFVEQMDLTQHLKLIHHICPICTKGFQDKFELKSHLSDHTEAQLQEIMAPFRCSDCGKRFSRNSALQRHMLLHSEQNQFKCTVCEKCFNRESSLTKHTESHRLTCSECGVKMDSIQTVNIHLNRVHKICTVCQERFTDGDLLKAHLKAHGGICPECGANLKMSLSLHLCRAHLMCPVCEEHFTDKVHLKEHLKIHVKDGTLDLSSAQIVSCEECGDLFFQKSKLWTHMSETGHKGNTD